MSAVDVYDVEAVRGFRHNTDRGGRDEYLIKWLDSDEQNNSWVPTANLGNVSLELAKKYQEKMDNLPWPSFAYRRQARQLLLNTFQRVSCAAIDEIIRLSKFNFTRSFYSISVINHQRTSNDGNGAGKFDLIPIRVKVFIKQNRQKAQLVELTDETLLGEIEDIPTLNLKEGPTKQRAATPKKLMGPVIDLTADSSDEEGKREQEEEEKECLCCYGDYPVSALKQCSAGEGHYVCRECIQRYVSEQLDGNGSTVFKCIASADCKCEYSLVFLDRVLSPLLKKRANEMVALEEIKKASGEDDDSLWQCPKCAYMGFVDGKPQWIDCPECNVTYCTSCNANHTNRSCEEFRREQVRGKDPKHLAAEAMSRSCKRSCPHCGQEYMKSDGCNKIKCKCGRLSCYLCGAVVADYSHFCNKAACPCGNCKLWTSTTEMERIDREKRQEAGRNVLFEQGIADEEEIVAILRSLDEEEDDQSFDTAAAVHRGEAGYQRAAAAAFLNPADLDVGWHQRLQAQIAEMDRMVVNIGAQAAAGHNPLPQRNPFGAAAPAPQRAAPPVAAVRAEALNPPAAAVLPNRAAPAPQRADPPAVAAGHNPQQFVFGAAAPVPRRADLPAVAHNPQQFAFGALVPQRAAPPAAGNPPHEFNFGAAARVHAAVRAEAPNPPAAALPNRAAPAPQRVDPPAVAAGHNPQQFAFGAAAPVPQRAAPTAVGFAFGVGNRIRSNNFNGALVQVAQVQRNQQQHHVNQLAENFDMLGLGQRDDNGAPGGRQFDAIQDGVRGLRLFHRLLSSARVHATEGRAREMENDLSRARALAERPDARINYGISMHHYEVSARSTRRRLQFALLG